MSVILKETHNDLARAYMEAMALLERAAERENLDSQTIRQCAELEQEIIDTNPEKYFEPDEADPYDILR